MKNIILLCLLSFNLVAFSQTLPDTIHILEVKVSQKGITNETALIKTEIDSLVLAQTLTTTFSELLTEHSSLFIKTAGQGAMATASFRGTAASHTQVFWNGLQLNNQMAGQTDLSLIPIYFADEVSLYHGASSLQQTSGALGGSVHLNSKPQWNKKRYVSVTQSVASFNTSQTFLKIGGGNNKLHTKLRLFYEQSDNDFEFLNTANGQWTQERQQNANYNKAGALSEWYYQTRYNNFFSLSAWYQQTHRNLPAIMSYQGDGRIEIQNDRQIRILTCWKKYGIRYTFDWTIAYDNGYLNYYLAHNTPLGLLINVNSNSYTQSWFNKYNYIFHLTENAQLQASISYNRNKSVIADQKEFSGYSVIRNQTSGSLILNYNLNSTVSVYGLLRLERIDDTFTPVMPSLGLEFKPLETNRLLFKTNFARNYHSPTLNDLYWVPGGNPNLISEQGYIGDFALEQNINTDSTWQLEYTLTTYFAYINNWIVWQPSEYRYWSAANIQTVFSRGVELDAKISYHFLGQSKLNIKLNYALTHTTNQTANETADNSRGKQLIYIPIHKANFLTNLLLKQISLNYSCTFIGERFTTSSNVETRHSLPPYCLHNLSLSKKIYFKKLAFEIQANIYNLLDQNYQAILWRAMPQRNYKLVIKIDWN